MAVEILYANNNGKDRRIYEEHLQRVGHTNKGRLLL